jgi:hypothetical protein
LGVKKPKISIQSPKTEFGAQNPYGRVTYPSIGNFTWSKKKYSFGGQKGENKASEANQSCERTIRLTLFSGSVKIAKNLTKNKLFSQ